MLFTLSLILICLTSAVFVRRLGGGRGQSFWIFLSTAQFQLGIIAVVTSIIGQMTPLGWIAAQALLSFGVAYGFRLKLGTFGFHTVRLYLASLRTELRGIIQSLSPLSLAALICAIAFLISSAIAQFFTPIVGFDEKMYHASRVIYWLQHHSLLPYETHNDRQTVFTYGAELFFLWPTLFTRSEMVSRMFFWLGYPAMAAGAYLLLRVIRLSRGAAISGVLVLISTPIVSSYSVGLKPEMWSSLFLLGVAYWITQVCISPREVGRTHFFLAACVIQAINVRTTNLAVLPFAMLIPFLVRNRTRPAIRAAGLVTGMMAGMLLSGIMVPFGFNLIRYGHPLGPAEMRQAHQSDFGSHQLYTHAVRLPFLLAELPEMPDDWIRARASALGNHLIAVMGAEKPLSLERAGQWPGVFSYELPPRSQRFSIPGLLWLPVIIVALLQCAQNLIATFPRIKLVVTSGLAFLAIPLLAATVLGIRWMTQAGMPERLMIGPFVLSVCLGAALINSVTHKSRGWSCVAIIGIAWSIYPPLQAAWLRAATAIIMPASAPLIDSPFNEPLSLIGCGARILFVGSQDALDYPLFRPRDHYCNDVVSWGQEPFSVKRLTTMVESQAATYILIQNDEMVSFHWKMGIRTKPIVDWLSNNPGIRPIPLLTPHMRLFATNRAARRVGGANPVTNNRAPAETPLIFVSQELAGRVTVDPSLLRTPWAIEPVGPPGQGFLWVGSRLEEGLQFVLWARVETEARVRVDVSPGAGRGSPHSVSFLAGDKDVADKRPVETRQWLEFKVKLSSGRNNIRLWTDDQPTAAVQPNGDTRHLMLALHQVTVMP